MTELDNQSYLVILACAGLIALPCLLLLLVVVPKAKASRPKSIPAWRMVSGCVSLATGMGLALMAPVVAAGTIAVGVLGVFDPTNTGRPGGFVWFSDESRASVSGFAAIKSGRFVLNDSADSWRFDSHLDKVSFWDEQISVPTVTPARPESGTRRMKLNGVILVPNDERLVGRNVSGVLELEVLFPELTGPGVFRNARTILSIPLRIHVVEPALMRRTLDAFYLLGFGGVGSLLLFSIFPLGLGMQLIWQPKVLRDTRPNSRVRT